MTWTKLHDACEHQDKKDVIQRALEDTEADSPEAVQVDDHGSTPLHIACWSNPPEDVVKALIESYPQAVTDQDLNGNTPLHVAASFPETDTAVVEILLKAAPTAASMTNHEGLMPLHAACRFSPSNEGVISQLLEVYPYALRSRTKMGDPAPRRKSSHDSKDELIDKKPSSEHVVVDAHSDGQAHIPKSGLDLRFEHIGVQVRDGSYPLHMAIAAGAPVSVIDMLCHEAEDTVTLVNKHGETPLHVALSHHAGDDIIEMLLQTDKDNAAVQIQDKLNGNLPLHVGVAHGCDVAAVVDLLTRYSHAVHIKNSAGLSPEDVAKAHNCSDEIIDVLAVSDSVDALEDSWQDIAEQEAE